MVWGVWGVVVLRAVSMASTAEVNAENGSSEGGGGSTDSPRSRRVICSWAVWTSPCAIVRSMTVLAASSIRFWGAFRKRLLTVSTLLWPAASMALSTSSSRREDPVRISTSRREGGAWDEGWATWRNAMRRLWRPSAWPGFRSPRDSRRGPPVIATCTPSATDLLNACRGHDGDRLVSLAVYGSVGRVRRGSIRTSTSGDGNPKVTG